MKGNVREVKSNEKCDEGMEIVTDRQTFEGATSKKLPSTLTAEPGTKKSVNPGDPLDVVKPLCGRRGRKKLKT